MKNLKFGVNGGRYWYAPGDRGRWMHYWISHYPYNAIVKGITDVLSY